MSDFPQRRIAAISDVHGCIDEFKTLVERLKWLSLDEIWHVGDILDRGPDSGAVVQYCRENGILGLMGNHEESILKHYERVERGGPLPHNADKARTLSQIKDPRDWDYLKGLPYLHVIDDLKLVLVHGGLWPGLSFHQQPKNVCRAQMIHPNKLGDCRWFGVDASKHRSGKTEEQNYSEGYRRWYELFDHEFSCVYGHSVFSQPFLHQNRIPHLATPIGKTLGIDTGSCFGGMITAAVIDAPLSEKDPVFVCVKARKVHFEKSYRIHQD